MTKLLSAADCLKLFGVPEEEKSLVLVLIPEKLQTSIPALPKRIYCNKLLSAPLFKAFENLIAAGIEEEFRTWDGCFNIRKKRGQASASLHSWGVAIDLNAAWNGFGKTPTLSKHFIDCFKRAGFDWGGDWNTPDGMHFQLSRKSVGLN